MKASLFLPSYPGLRLARLQALAVCARLGVGVYGGAKGSRGRRWWRWRCRSGRESRSQGCDLAAPRLPGAACGRMPPLARGPGLGAFEAGRRVGLAPAPTGMLPCIWRTSPGGGGFGIERGLSPGGLLKLGNGGVTFSCAIGVGVGRRGKGRSRRGSLCGELGKVGGGGGLLFDPHGGWFVGIWLLGLPGGFAVVVRLLCLAPAVCLCGIRGVEEESSGACAVVVCWHCSQGDVRVWCTFTSLYLRRHRNEAVDGGASSDIDQRAQRFDWWTCLSQPFQETLLFLRKRRNVQWCRGSGACWYLPGVVLIYRSCYSRVVTTGSLCCVAARPEGSVINDDGWSTGPHDTAWRSNGGFSPPLSSRWESKSQPDEMSSAAQSVQLQRSSLSSSSRGSRAASRAGSARYLSHHRNLSGSLFSHSASPSDSFRVPQWTPPASSQNGQLGDYVAASSDSISSPSITIESSKEGCPSAGLSTVSNTPESTPLSYKTNAGDSSRTPPTLQPSSSQRNGHGSHSFFSKPSFPGNAHQLSRQVSDSRVHAINAMGSRGVPAESRHSFRWSGGSGDSSHGGSSDWWSMQTFSELVASSRRERLRWSSASSPSDFGWGTSRENLEKAGLTAVERIRAGSSQPPSVSPSSEVQICGICTRLLSHRSPWSSNRMAGGAELAVVGVLVCGHVYHAECLEQSTPESKQQDPPCPQCSAAEKIAMKGLLSAETVPTSKGGQRVAASVAQSSSRNKLSRIGVVTDDISGPEYSYRVPHSVEISGGRSSQGSALLGEKPFLSKSLSRRQFSFRGKSSKETSDVGWRKPGSPARVSPDNSCVEELPTAALTKKAGRSSSFRYLRRW